MIIECAHNLRGWRQMATAFAAGSLSVLSQAPFHLWPVLFFTLPLLIWLIDGAVEHHANNPRQLLKKAAALGWTFGFGYFLFGLYWIGKAFVVEAGIFLYLLPIAMILMPAGLALFYSLAIGLAALFWKSGLSRVLTLALALAITEYLRGHIFTGFPWNALGHVFAGEAGLSQLSSLFDPYALSFFCVLIFGSPAIALFKRQSEQVKNQRERTGIAIYKAPLILVCSLLVASIWGHFRLHNAINHEVPNVVLRLVQPNIKQVDKWRPGNAGPIYRTMLELSAQKTKQSPQGLNSITHLIWPESALPFFMAHSPEALKGIEILLPDQVTLITGAMRYKPSKQVDTSSQRAVYNSLFVIDGKARITRTFDKKHLVPFGEYLPFQSVLEAIGLRQIVQVRGHFETGQQPRLVRLDNAPPFAPLICYEVVFPHEIIEQGVRPEWLLNLTNDAWYGVSTGPYQHFVQSRIRAIEQGLPMVRVANTGISGVIDPYGRVQQSLPLAAKGVLDAALPRAIDKTIYARYGKWLFWLVIGGAIGAILLLQRIKP
ncbi:MAG: apolipoprotein N-acyltransferase [bacterium]|nr:apolipoprotein N-acyltransferase [bacterium]